MNMFKDSRKEFIDKRSSVKISVGDALQEIEQFPTVDQYRNGLIGFINNQGVIIQFFRYDINDWLIDVPLLKATKPPYALQAEGLTTETVKKVVNDFFEGKNWKKHVHLQQG